MLPLPDENPTRILAWVALAFIAAGAIVLFGLLIDGFPAEQMAMLHEHAAVSWQATTGPGL